MNKNYVEIHPFQKATNAVIGFNKAIDKADLWRIKEDKVRPIKRFIDFGKKLIGN